MYNYTLSATAWQGPKSPFVTPPAITAIVNLMDGICLVVKASDFPMQINKAYLFGSFAKGCPQKDSDIDIALVVDEWVGGYEETVVTIWRLRKNVDFRIEPHIVVPDEDYADFLPEIQRTGIEIS